MSSRTYNAAVCFPIALAAFLLRTPTARAAGGGYEECMQILAGGILNTSSSSTMQESLSEEDRAETFFQAGEEEAYKRYSKDYKEAQKKGTKIDVGANYGPIGGSFGLSLSSEKMMSESEFNSEYRKERSQRSASSGSKKRSAQRTSQQLLNTTRDPETVRAWRDCVSKSRETGVYAFSTRDAANKVYINVIWVPGDALAGEAPSIPIHFVTDGAADGVKVKAKETEIVALGSGKNFAVECGKVCDGGFRIVVNAERMNARGQALNSFTNTVEVPALLTAAEQNACSWEGTWKTKWRWQETEAVGNITLTKEGAGFRGTYPYGVLEFAGTGNEIAGRFTNTAGTAGRCASGPVEFTKDGCSFEGRWGLCNEVPKHQWSGQKLP